MSFRDRHKIVQGPLDDQLASLRPESLHGEKLLVMRPLGDEANMGLVVSQFLSWLQNKVLSFLQGFQNGFLGRSDTDATSTEKKMQTEAKPRSLPAGCFITVLKLVGLVTILFLAFGDDSVETHAIGEVIRVVGESVPGNGILNLALQIVVAIPLMLLAGLLAFFVVYGIISLYALIGLPLAALPFGPDAMFWNHFTSTIAEPAPVGESPAQIFHAEPKGGLVHPGLAHSGIYTNSKAIHQIIKWIDGRGRAEE